MYNSSSLGAAAAAAAVAVAVAVVAAAALPTRPSQCLAGHVNPIHRQRRGCVIQFVGCCWAASCLLCVAHAALSPRWAPSTWSFLLFLQGKGGASH